MEPITAFCILAIIFTGTLGLVLSIWEGYRFQAICFGIMLACAISAVIRAKPASKEPIVTEIPNETFLFGAPLYIRVNANK